MIIWLASYPKSGNTFLRSLLSSYLLTQDGNFKLNALKQIKQFPSISLFKKFGIDTSNDLELVKNYIKVQRKINLLDKKNIRFLKTHSILNEINGHQFTDTNNTLGVIYVVRDPRTVVKSYASHHQMSLKSATDKLFEFSTLTESTEHSHKTGDRRITHVGSWASNYNTWKHFKKTNRYFLVKYENLVANTEKTFIDLTPAASIKSHAASSIILDFLITISPVTGFLTSPAVTLPSALSDKLTTTLPPSKISESSINPGSSHLTLVIVKS